MCYNVVMKKFPTSIYDNIHMEIHRNHRNMDIRIHHMCRNMDIRIHHMCRNMDIRNHRIHCNYRIHYKRRIHRKKGNCNCKIRAVPSVYYVI